MRIDFHFDFETRSRSNLKTVGTVNYALDPSTEARLLTYSFGRSSTIKYWKAGDPIPADILDVALHPEKYNFIAWNIAFDYMIWTYVFSKVVVSMKKPTIDDLTDAMAMGCHYRCGPSLEAAAATLGFTTGKNKEGRAIMLKQCKPNAKGHFVELTDIEWQKFIAYGIQDTRLLRDIYYQLPPLPASERFAWEWTFKTNLKGIRVDLNLVNELGRIIEAYSPRYEQEFYTITGGVQLSSPTQTLAFFKQFYPHIENMQEDTVRDILDDDRRVPPYVRRAIEIKDLAGGAAIKKVEAAKRLNYNGRIYNILVYHMAQTKRWAGSGIQIQNFARPDNKALDKIDFDLNVEDIASIVASKVPTLKDPLGFVKNLLRRIWLPDEGQAFYCGDWSKIEPTVLFWLVGLGRIPGDWYEQMASEIYGIPASQIGKNSDERQIGKNTALGSGYGMGHVKFRNDIKKKTGMNISEGLSEQAIKAYRRKYYQVTQLWRALESSFRMAIEGYPSSICEGKIHVMPMDGMHRGVIIRLPSGSHLFYHRAHVNEKNELCYVTSDDKGRVVIKNVYGGLLTEHVTSATARDIILPAIYRIEQAGFTIPNLVHDEVWGFGKPGREKEFEHLMCVRPSWCSDLDIGASIDCGVRYLK